MCLAVSAFAIDPNRMLSQYAHTFWETEKGFPGGPVPVQGAAGDAGLLSDGVESGSPDPLSSQDVKGSCIDPGPGAGLTRIKTPPGLLHHTIMQQKCCTVPPTHTGPPAPARCGEGSPR